MTSTWKTGLAAAVAFGLGAVSTVMLRPSDAGAAEGSPTVTVEGDRVRVTADVPDQAFLILGSTAGEPLATFAVGEVLLDVEELDAVVYRFEAVKRLEGREERWCNRWADCPIPPPPPPIHVVLAGKSTMGLPGAGQVPGGKQRPGRDAAPRSGGDTSPQPPASRDLQLNPGAP